MVAVIPAGHSYIRAPTRLCRSTLAYSFSRKQLWNPKNAINPLKKLVSSAGDAFALNGMLGGPPKTTATDEGPEATTRSVRAAAVACTALPLAGPMVSAMVVASEFPDVGVSVSCRICGAGRSSGISPRCSSAGFRQTCQITYLQVLDKWPRDTCVT